MKRGAEPVAANTVADLRDAVLAGRLGVRPEELTVTGCSTIYQTTQLPASRAQYHNRYLLMRVEASFGACSHTADQLPPEAAAEWSGMPLDAALSDVRLPVRIAAMDAYLGAVLPHEQHAGRAVDIQPGTPGEKAARRDALIAELADVRPAQKVALIGVVNPLVAAIRQRGGVCLPCDLALDVTEWGDAVEKDMYRVLDEADSVISTGMTMGNGTFDAIVQRVRERGIPLTVYAQTGSAVAARFVGRGVTSLVAEPFPFTQFSAGPSRIYLYRHDSSKSIEIHT